jgi:flagellar biogenesis protein FliO
VSVWGITPGRAEMFKVAMYSIIWAAIALFLLGIHLFTRVNKENDPKVFSRVYRWSWATVVLLPLTVVFTYLIAPKIYPSVETTSALIKLFLLTLTPCLIEAAVVARIWWLVRKFGRSRSRPDAETQRGEAG